MKYGWRPWPGVKWTPEQIHDQSGKTFVITGANSGIGFHAAKRLVEAGGDVIIACRRVDAAEEAASKMTGPGSVHVEQLDLADLDSVAEFVARAPKSIDVLVNNAGVMMTPKWMTKQGWEYQWGINVVGHMALTKALLPRIQDRIVNIASLAHGSGAIDPTSFRGEHYDAMKSYAQSKLGNLIFTLELQRHLEEIGSHVRVVAAHPGVTLTRLAKDSKWWVKIMFLPYVPLLMGGDKGSWPTLKAAVDDVPGGSYWGPDGRGERRGTPAEARIAGRCHKPDYRKAVWELYESL